MIEFEGKILDVDPGFYDRLANVGGRMVHAGRLQRRYVYDITPGDQTRWVRLRDNGATVTLATKYIRHDGIDGTTELEVEVSDFEGTNRLLESMGFTAKGYQENYRTAYEVDGAEVVADHWPLLEPYLEIEGRDRDHVVKVAELLGFTEDQLTGANTTKIYAMVGIDLTAIADLRF